MLRAIAPVAALLLSVAFLLMGNGLQNTLTPVRANMDGFSSLAIGLLGGGYYLGFAAGCLTGPYFVKRAGHIRTFAAMGAVASCVSLLQAMFIDEYAWVTFRIATGVCFAVLYMVVESWLNEKATNETRGRVFSAYIVVNLTVVTIGQLMLTLDDATSFALFALASILVSLAAVPLTMTTSEQPRAPSVVRLRLLKLYRASPVGVVGAFAVGLSNGAFWMLGPVFALSGQAEAGASAAAFFMATGAVAGAIGQWPLGLASDRMDRRRVIIFACGCAAVAGVAMWRFGDGAMETRLICAAAFGAFAIPVYALCAAHMNDMVDADSFVEAASGLLLTFSLGAVAGPVLASVVMGAIGPSGLFAFTALVHLSLILFTLVRMRARGPASATERGEFAEAAAQAGTVAPIAAAQSDEPGPTGRPKNG